MTADKLTKGLFAALSVLLLLVLGIAIWLLITEREPAAVAVVEPMMAAEEPTTEATAPASPLPPAIVIELPKKRVRWQTYANHRKGAHMFDHLLLTMVIGIAFGGQRKAFWPFLGRGWRKRRQKPKAAPKQSQATAPTK
ncbi:MAG: hypothetical protein ACE5FD_14755 [Anaerolineae bacterium]